MANVVVSRRNIRADDVFFPAMSLLILGIVVTGFAQSFFFAGMIFAPLPDAIVRIHGTLLVSWIFLLVVQNVLVAVRKTKWHMTLGILGFVLPPLMLVFGMLTLFDSIRRNDTPVPGTILLVGDSEALLIFTIATLWGIAVRRNAVSHKRLMLLGTLAIIGPAIDRWNLPIGILGTLAITLSIPMIVVAYDLVTRRRLLRATAVPYALSIVSILTLFPVAQLPIVHAAVALIVRA